MLTVGLAVLGVFVTYGPITAVSVALATIGQATTRARRICSGLDHT